MKLVYKCPVLSNETLPFFNQALIFTFPKKDNISSYNFNYTLRALKIDIIYLPEPCYIP